MTFITRLLKFIKPVVILFMRTVGIFVIYKILTAYDWKNIGQILVWKNLLVLIVAMALYIIKLMVDALRSKRLASALGVAIPYGQLLKFNFQSVAFDFVLPVPQAEEVYRFGRFVTYAGKKKALVLAICIRATGLIATLTSLAITVFFTSLKLKPLVGRINIFWVYFIFFDLTVAIISIAIYLTRKHRRDPVFINKLIEQATLLKQYFYGQTYYLIEGITLSFLSQLAYAATIFFICWHNGGNVTFFKIFLIVPLIYFGGMVPVGMAGLGIKEAVIAWALQQFGVPQATAWRIALFHLVIMVVYLLLGAVLLVTERRINVFGGKPLQTPDKAD